MQYLVLLGDMEVRSLEVRQEFLGIWCFKNQGQMLGGFGVSFQVNGEIALSDWHDCDREAGFHFRDKYHRALLHYG